MFKKKCFRFFLLIFILIIFGIILFLIIPLNVFDLNKKIESSKIYDRKGELLYEILIPEKGKQSYLSLSKISPYVLESIIAIEDQNFYHHHGIDFGAILRAAWQNFYSGEIISGASTLEQQLVRNLLHHQKRTVWHKIQETFFAFKLNLHYDKNEILEKYLNTVYFGNLAYGVETAAQTYFGKSASQLDLAESAFLAGLPQSPSQYSPYVNLTAGLKRQQNVLSALFAQSKISQTDYSFAQQEKLVFQKQKLVNLKAPHFVMWILAELEKSRLFTEISQGGFSIYTTIDLSLQKGIQEIVNKKIEQLSGKNIQNAAVVVLDQKNGEVLAMLGSKDYFDESIDGEVNVALALRQPGSTLKPFLYALAFEKGLSPEVKILDEAVQYQTIDGHPYEPKNYDLKFHGQVSLREALAQSLNIPAVKILNYIGLNHFLSFLHDFEITSLNQSGEYYGLSLALGSGEVTLLELTRAYGVLGNLGNLAPLHGILKITSTDVDSVLFNQVEKTREILTPEITSQITSVLADNQARLPAFGEDNLLQFNYPVAAKTGTSRNFRDNLTLGYTPQRTVGVWVGNSDGEAMINSSGITGAGPIFHNVLDFVMKDLPHQNFPKVTQVDSKIEEKIFEALEQKKLKQTKSQNQLSYRQNLIIYPFDGDVFQISSDLPLEKQILKFKAKETGEWLLNNLKIGQGKELEWQLVTGNYVLKFKIGTTSEEIHFSVR